jgi:uncharacterized membrane protein YciS (DUF1049 family)
MSVNEIVAFIAVLLIIINMFFTTDYPTKVAYVLMSYSLVMNTGFDLVFKIGIGIAIWLLLVSFHLLVWRHILYKIHNRSEILKVKLLNNKSATKSGRFLKY